MSMQAEGLGAIMAGKIPGALPNVVHGHRTAETDGRSGLVFCAPPCPLDGRTGIRPYTFAPAGPFLICPGPADICPRARGLIYFWESKNESLRRDGRCRLPFSPGHRHRQ